MPFFNHPFRHNNLCVSGKVLLRAAVGVLWLTGRPVSADSPAISVDFTQVAAGGGSAQSAHYHVESAIQSPGPGVQAESVYQLAPVFWFSLPSDTPVTLSDWVVE